MNDESRLAPFPLELENACENSKNEKSLQKTASFSVDPPGLEPGLFWTKTRRVANYTTGQSLLSFL